MGNETDGGGTCQDTGIAKSGDRRDGHVPGHDRLAADGQNMNDTRIVIVCSRARDFPDSFPLMGCATFRLRSVPLWTAQK